MKTSEIKKLLAKAGCYKLRDGKRHEIWFSPITGNNVIVGRHDTKDVPVGTADNILKAAGLK